MEKTRNSRTDDHHHSDLESSREATTRAVSKEQIIEWDWFSREEYEQLKIALAIYQRGSEIAEDGTDPRDTNYEFRQEGTASSTSWTRSTRPTRHAYFYAEG